MFSKKGSICCPFLVDLCLLFALKKKPNISAFFALKSLTTSNTSSMHGFKAVPGFGAALAAADDLREVIEI